MDAAFRKGMPPVGVGVAWERTGRSRSGREMEPILKIPSVNGAGRRARVCWAPVLDTHCPCDPGCGCQGRDSWASEEEDLITPMGASALAWGPRPFWDPQGVCRCVLAGCALGPGLRGSVDPSEPSSQEATGRGQAGALMLRLTH